MSVGSMKSKFEKNLGQIHYKVDWMDEMNFVIVNTNTNTKKMENGYRSSEFYVFYKFVSQIRYDEAAKALTVVLVECKVETFFILISNYTS